MIDVLEIYQFHTKEYIIPILNNVHCHFNFIPENQRQYNYYVYVLLCWNQSDS